MKKIILVFAAIVIAAVAYAQTDTIHRRMSPRDMKKNQNQNLQNNPNDKSHTDGVMMLDGKMIMVMNGKMTILEHEMTMSNGTKIMSDGTCIRKDGTKMQMREGQHIDMAGNMVPMQTNKDRNMYLVPDSIKNKEF